MTLAFFTSRAPIAILAAFALSFTSCASRGQTGSNKVYGEEILAAPVTAVNVVAGAIMIVPIAGVGLLVSAGLTGV